MIKNIITGLFAFFLVLNIPNHVKADIEYIGSEVCKACHGDPYASYATSIHAKKAIPGSPANKEGCESCHGPGAQHAEKGGGRGVAIFAFGKKIDAKEKSSKCLACHEEQRGVAFWSMSKHKSAGVSCDECHSIHSAGVKKDLLSMKEPDLCFGCHKSIRGQTNKQSHHSIREGKVRCSDCHNSMGTLDVKAMLRADLVNNLCYKCHAEKRGPNAFEHPPVPENCLNCHEIHGSNHFYLLVRKVPQLCQSCHNIGRHPTSPYTSQHTFLGNATSSKIGCLPDHVGTAIQIFMEATTRL